MTKCNAAPAGIQKIATVLVAFGVSGLALAQSSPMGRWQTIDDKTKQPKAEVVIEEKGGALVGRMVKFYAPPAEGNPDRICRVCTDDRKDKPAMNMEVIRGAKKDASDEGAWSGKILDPENGKEYKLRMWPEADGKTLNVRGYIGVFYRTQQWKRAD